MKVIYIGLGFISLFLGILGIFLPILPTTPFLLLTLYLFSKGSNTFHAWFINTKFYTKFLSSFVETRSMTRLQKWTLLICVDAILITTIIIINERWVTILLVFLIILKHYYFHTQIKTK